LIVGQFPTTISDSFGYSSIVEYGIIVNEQMHKERLEKYLPFSESGRIIVRYCAI
jgi:hypothetical protein